MKKFIVGFLFIFLNLEPMISIFPILLNNSQDQLLILNLQELLTITQGHLVPRIFESGAYRSQNCKNLVASKEKPQAQGLVCHKQRRLYHHKLSFVQDASQVVVGFWIEGSICRNNRYR